MRSRWWWWLVLVVIAVLAVLLWPRSRTSSSTPAGSGSAGGTTVSTASRATGSSPRADLGLTSWFGVPSAKPRKVAGRVTRDGKPLANATVGFQSLLTPAGLGTVQTRQTGADGRFDFGMWPVGPYKIAASAAELQPTSRMLDLADPHLASDAIELALRPCSARVSGRITDSNDAAIADAEVHADDFVLAKANARGEYSACVPYGDIELDYSADGYGAVALRLDMLGSVTQDVVLVPAASISGHVVRATDGTPVAEALVTVFPREWSRQHPSARSAISDASGAFRIDGLTPAAYRVWGFADGLTSDPGAEAQAIVGASVDVTLRLVDTARVRGRVLRGDQPVAGVSVSAVRKSPTARSRAPAWTQSDGTFDLVGVPVGDIVFSVDGYEVTSPAVQHIEKAGTVEGVTIQVAAMATIKGVVTRNHVPVAGARVCCVPNRAEPFATSDDSGHYELAGLAPGTYPLNAGSDEVGAFTLGGPVTVKAGETKTVDFELELAAEIAGTVVDADGHPVRDVFVRWIHQKTQDEGRGPTDALGHYRCRAMSGGGVYRAVVFPSSEASKPFPPAPGTSYPTREVKDGATKIEDVTIAIDMKQLPLSGRVVDSTGAGVADVIVRATGPDSNEPFATWRKLPMTATDEDGNFTLRDLLPGAYSLQARASDGAETTVAGIAAGSTDVKLTLVRPGRIEGTLAGYTQVPVIYATPWAGPNNLLPGTVTGTTYRVNGVKPGRYLVNAQTAYEGDAKVVEVRSGETVKLDLSAKGRGAIDGVVLDFQTKKPLAGAVCRVTMSVDGQQGLTNWDTTTAPKSDEQGRLVIDPAPAGNVVVACMMTQGRQSQPSVELNVPPNGRVSATLLSAHLDVENPVTPGIGFDWFVTPPRISEIVPRSAAAKAGLLVGDLITAVDGVSVAGLSGSGVQFLIMNHATGTSVSLTYQRGATSKTVTVPMEPPPP